MNFFVIYRKKIAKNYVYFVQNEQFIVNIAKSTLNKVIKIIPRFIQLNQCPPDLFLDSAISSNIL